MVLQCFKKSFWIIADNLFKFIFLGFLSAGTAALGISLGFFAEGSPFFSFFISFSFMILIFCTAVYYLLSRFVPEDRAVTKKEKSAGFNKILISGFSGIFFFALLLPAALMFYYAKGIFIGFTAVIIVYIFLGILFYLGVPIYFYFQDKSFFYSLKKISGLMSLNIVNALLFFFTVTALNIILIISVAGALFLFIINGVMGIVFSLMLLQDESGEELLEEETRSFKDFLRPWKDNKQ